MKNLFKKIGALLVAAVMVLSMCTAVFADGDATITLGNFADADSLKYMQIIEPDQTQPTGWKFSNEVAKSAFTGETKENAQNTLWMLILKADPNAALNKELNIPKGIGAISNADIDKALSTIKSNKAAQWITLENKESLVVNKAGVYAFDAEKDKYTYKVATAYVGFGTYENAPTLQNTTVEAKRSHLDIEKTVGDEDHAVAIGDVVEYTIKTYVPYIDANNTESRKFRITDEIKGADYVLGEDGNVAGTVVLGDGNTISVETTIVPNENDKHSFEINLDSLVANADNPNAGVLVTVKYNAKITSVTVENTAKGHKSYEEYGGTNDKVKLYTGTIVLTKIDAKSETTKLANAEFTVHEVTTKDNQEVVGEALKFDYDKVTGVYTYNPDSSRTAATIVVTNTAGAVTVKGLDKGKYHFTETKAPNGYSINEAGADINLTFEGNVATANFENTSGKLKDSRLSSLPSTGGMGTYLFTIIGVVVMAGAAGAFFISRRKGSEE